MAASTYVDAHPGEEVEVQVGRTWMTMDAFRAMDLEEGLMCLIPRFGTVPHLPKLERLCRHLADNEMMNTMGDMIDLLGDREESDTYFETLPFPSYPKRIFFNFCRTHVDEDDHH